MKRKVLLIITSFVFLILTFAPIQLFSQEYKWFKGNTHTHTINSDGDSPPRVVVRWYRDHGYNFLMITDHNFVTEIKYIDTDKNDDFILIYGEEVTDSYKKTPVHLNCFGTGVYVSPQKGNSVIETLQRNIDAIRKAGGVPQINHPNWHWAFNDNEMKVLKNCKLFEIFNPGCNYFGGLDTPSMEKVWDSILTAGVVMYGMAVDDMHKLATDTGKGWVMVKAKELTTEAILNALENGQFYASNGVTIDEWNVTPEKYEIKIKGKSDWKYVTRFIGEGGKLLKKDGSLNPVYRFNGTEKYVRAVVMDSNGNFAWLQPYFIKK
ncbi:hypothetical protein DRQ09_02345 [candidate division KSB1 bacterium]|nr:MAG: hypothetical protein DRQ09_02345 [candidate division KSB1 bacterium]